MAEIRRETVVRREADVVRGGDDDVGDDATFEACHAVGEDFCGTPPTRWRASAIDASVVVAFSSVAKATNLQRE